MDENSLTKEEKDVLQIAIDEYNDLFPNIMIYSQLDFIPTLERYIQITCSKTPPFLPKIIKIIQTKYYEPEYKKVNQLIQSIDNIKVCEKYNKKNFIPHCNNTSSPIHSCGEKLYSLNYYLLCLKCKLIYKSNCVLFHCDACDIDYYTSIDNSNGEKEKKYKPATWEKYHCNAVINDVMKCFKCKSVLYLNVDNKKLCCLKCNFEIEQERIKWKCMICREEFLSQAKEYNPLEYKAMKIAVKKSLFDGIEAKPDYVPCCNIKPKDIKNYTFHHKKECNGILYLGTLNKNKIVVCSKCHMLNYYDHHYWMCPICKERFKLTYKEKEKELFENRGRGRERKDYNDMKMQRKNSQILRYDTPHNGHNGYNNSSNSSMNISNTNIDTNKSSGHSSIPIGSSNRMESSNKMDGSNRNSEKERFRNASSNVIRRTSRDKGVSVFKLNMESAEKQQHAKSPNKVNKMDINSLSEFGRRFANVNINNKGNMNSSNNIRRIPLPFNIKRQGSSSNCVQNSSSNSINNTNNSSSTTESSQKPLIQTSNTFTPKTSIGLSQSDNTFRSDDFMILKQIGEGTFGKIYVVENRQKKRYAMKKILASTMVEINALKNEYNMINSLKQYQLNLVTIYGIEYKQLDKTTYVMYVLMDLAIKDWEKEIESRKQQKKFYTEQELIVIMKELIFTFAELQRHNISHRDIKPQNILLFPDKSFRIADFGEAKEVLANTLKNTVKQTIRGTELYMSPILFKALKLRGMTAKYTEHNTFKSDVFSLGLCFLLAATLTFNSLCEIRELEEMFSIKVVLAKYLKRKYSSKFLDVMYMMLEVNEKFRPDFIELNKVMENNFE